MAQIAATNGRALLHRWAGVKVDSPADGFLLEQFIAMRHEAAFRALVDRHGPMVMGVCRRVLHNVHDAEDAFQATFLVLARKADSVSPRDLVGNWLHGVAWRTAQKARVARRRSGNLIQRLFARDTNMPGRTAKPPETWQDIRPILDAELQRLPANYRIAIVLCDLEGQSRKEAAQQLGWPEGTLSGRLARARKMLADRLTSRGITLSVAALTTLFAENSLSASVPAALKANLVQAGLLVAGGKAISGALVSSAAVALSEKVMNAMLLTKQAMAVLLFATVGLVVATTQLIARVDADKKPAVQLNADAELHMIGVYQAKGNPGTPGPITVEVRATEKPVVLAMTSYFPVEWRVKLADGARIRKVIVSGYSAQEVKGLPDDVPVDNRSYYPNDGSRSKNGWFYAHEWNTPKCREVVRRLNELTGLPLATFQSEEKGEAFIVDGQRGRTHSQAGVTPRPTRREAKPDELRALANGADLHIVGTYGPDQTDLSRPIDVEVRSPSKPIVLVLTSYLDSLWKVKAAEGTRIKAVLLGGSSPQEVDGLPAGVPVFHFCPEPATFFEGNRQYRDAFYAYKFNSGDYRKMVDRLNDMTGLLVASFQDAEQGKSFTVDGKRGAEFAQKERRIKPAPPKPVKAEELRAAADGADLHLVSVYWTGPGSDGSPIDVEVKATGKPVVVALASYFSVLWRVKIAEGAQVKAVIIGGYFEQESEGIPANVPLIYKQYYPNLNTDFFYAYKTAGEEYENEVNKLNDMTGRLISTAQIQYQGNAFVIDGVKGSELQQKSRLTPTTKTAESKKTDADEDPLADVADIPSKEMQAGGDADKRYFLIGPKKDVKAPSDGFGLVIIMPGGDGSADFNPFVRRIYKNAVGDTFIAAQPVAPKWTSDQKIVWPTKTSPVDKMKFSTEEFVDAVIADVAKQQKIDRSKVFTLSWSSGGPAAYATSLREKSPVTGSLVAMSIFRPEIFPPLKLAKGHAYYLYHSPQDRICKYAMAEDAKAKLTDNGAKVKMETYQGGHGWRGNMYGDIRKGIEWLEENRPKTAKP